MAASPTHPQPGALRGLFCALLAAAALGVSACSTGPTQSEQFADLGIGSDISHDERDDDFIALGFAAVQDSNPQAPPPTSDLTVQQQRQLQIFSQIVLNPSDDIDSETRRNAAHELLAIGTPQAIEALAAAVQSGRAANMLAAISAIQVAVEPVPALMDPAIAALPTAPAAALDSLTWAVARYGEPAMKIVAEMALNRSTATAARLGPIAALSAFDSQRAAATLMQIVNDTAESAEIIKAACEGLQRLSGLSHGTDLVQWRAWWKEAGALPARQWTAFITKSLSKRAATLQSELQKQRETNERIARELFAAYRDLYPALPTDEQLRRLPTLLNDPLAPVREFAISRLSLLLRDSVRIPMEVQAKVAERLGDDVPALRIASANLLHELNYEMTGPLIAERLRNEQSTQAVAAFLALLEKRPCAEAVEPPVKWLTDADLGDLASAVLWRSLDIGANGQGEIAMLREEVRKALDQRTSPALLRLLAWIGDADDVASLSDLLDAADVAERTAIAVGFCRRGLKQPLIDRISDSAVYPSAVRVLAEGDADLSSFQLLVSWTPVESMQVQWADAVEMLAGKLPVATLLQADDVLAAAPHAGIALRKSVLSRAIALPRQELPIDQRNAIIARYAPMLIEQGEASSAHALLEGMNCQEPLWRTMCFQAAALSGNFDKASEVQSDVNAWLSLLMDLAARDLKSAGPLCNEITRRFNGRLSSDDRRRVEEISRQVEDTAAASASASSDDFNRD